MGLFSQDRPRIPGDPPHLEIMTKIGHALPDKARRVLAASAMIGKGKFKGAKQVMTRKQPLPKLEEGLVDSIKAKVKKLNTGKPYRNYDGNDPYEDAPKEHIKSRKSSGMSELKEAKKPNKADHLLKKIGDKIEKSTKEFKKKEAANKKPNKKSAFDGMQSTNRKGLREEQLNELTGKGKLTYKPGKRKELKNRLIKKKEMNDSEGKIARDRLTIPTQSRDMSPSSSHLPDEPIDLKKGAAKTLKAKLKTSDRMDRMIKRIDEVTLSKRMGKKLAARMDKKLDDRQEKTLGRKYAGDVGDMKKLSKDKHYQRLNNIYSRARHPEWNEASNKIRRKYGKYAALKEGRTAGENIDARIARNAERADHHTDEYNNNPRGIQSAEHASKADRHTAVYQRLKQFKKTGKIHEEKLDEGVLRKAQRVVSKALGIQRRRLSKKIDKQYWDNDKKRRAYKETSHHYANEYDKSGLKSDKAGFHYYNKQEYNRLNRSRDLNNRGRAVEKDEPFYKKGKYLSGKKLNEAVSRKLIAKKNATKQRVKYVQRKGELPPIMKGRGRYKITNKETNKLSGILDKQKAFRRDAKNATLEKKKGYSLPDPPESSRATSMTVFAKSPLPGEHVHNAQPHPAALPPKSMYDMTQKPVETKKTSTQGEDLIRAYNHYSGRYAQSGDELDLNAAKKAALAHYAMTIAKISHHPGHPEYDTARINAKSMLDAHIHALKSIEEITPKKIEPPKKKGFLSRLLRK